MPTSPMRQTHFQWFQDDAPPAANSPLRAQDSNLAALPPGAHVLLRIQSQHAGLHSFSAARRLQYRKVGSNQWHDLGAYAAPPYDSPLAHPSTWFADGDPIEVQRLSTPTDAGSGDFVGGHAKQADSSTPALVYGRKDFTEDLWSLWVHPLAPPGLDLEFRVTGDGTPYEHYLVYPRLTTAGYAPSEMDVKANQLAADSRPLAALQYRRDGAWRDLTDRLLFPFTITRRLKAVTTAELRLDNADGALARDNPASSWNQDAAGGYDPLLDEGRMLRIRQGVELHPNLAYGMPYDCGSPPPTRPESLRGGELTDGGFGQPRNERDDAWVGWHGLPATITFTLSPARHVSAVAVSLQSRRAAGVLLPGSASVTLIGSEGEHTAPLPVDHLRDDSAGRRQYAFALDLGQRHVSQVIFRLWPATPDAWVHLDEVAIYDASTCYPWLKTTFTGLLGDDITQHADERGAVHLAQVRDTTKRLSDLFVEVFDHYANHTIEGIIEDLLTNPRYEAALSPHEFALDTTGFTLPKWTEQNATLLDACAQLAKMVGWVFEADEEGIYTLHDLEWSAESAEDTYLADRDLLGWAASASGLNLRNRVTVKSRDARNREIAVTVEDPESIARYGPRLFTLFEPTMRSAPLARQLASAICRDYGRVQPSGSGVALGDVFMRPGRIVTVVHSGCTHSGPAQLYRVEALCHRQTGHRHGDHTMTLELRGYRPRLPTAPDSLVARPRDGAVELHWAPQPEDPSIIGYRAFLSETLAGSYTQVASVAAPPTLISGLTNTQTYWFSVGAWSDREVLGELAGPLPCAPAPEGPPTQAELAWQPQSLTATLVTIWGRPRPRLVWLPRLPCPLSGCYNIYRSQVSTGPFALIATCSQPGLLPVQWLDYGASSLSGDLYYEVTYYHPHHDFESWPSSTAHVALP